MQQFYTKSFNHLILIMGLFIMIVPFWLIFASSTHTSSIINTQGLQFWTGDHFFDNYDRVLNKKGGFFSEITASRIFLNSFIMAVGVASISVVTSLMAAYAIVYFKINRPVCFFG